MSDRKIRHVEDIFSGRGVGDGRPANILDKKSNFNNAFKNKKAPAPPKGVNPLPKIGNYQPKIYMEPKPGSPTEIDNTKVIVTADVHEHTKENRNDEKIESVQEINKEMFIIGDKDIPIIIEEKSDVKSANVESNVMADGDVFTEDETPVPMPRRKRRAPSAPDESNTTTNPIFGRSLSQSSDTTRLDKDFETQGGDIDFAYGLDNPGYEQRDYTRTRPEHAPAHIPTRETRGSKSTSEDELPYIPPPDYDDEELTMDFDDEPEVDPDRTRNAKQSGVFKDYEGEDFGRYLDDDFDYKIEQSRRRQNPLLMNNRRDQQFLPRPPPRDMRKSHKKKPRKDSDVKRNTIRDFTFSDSKIGWGDRTVNSTSAKGRYIKREKDRKRIDMTEINESENTGPTPGSYEEFLRMKNEFNHHDSPNSSDSGVEVGDEGQFMDMYLHSQPKQYKKATSKYESRKPSVWKRLTLRFKKSVNVTNSGNR